MELTALVGYLSEWMGAAAIAWILLSSPRLRRPPLGFQFPRREGIMALSLFLLITTASFIIYATTPAEFSWSQPLPAPTLELPRALFMAGITLIPVIVALVARGQPARSAGWNQTTLRTGSQIGLALALLTIFLRNRVFDVLGGVNSDSMPALLLSLGIAVAEETTFRGYIQPRLAAWVGQWPGLALSAALFSVWHLAAWINSLPFATILILFGLTFAQGLVLGLVMRGAGHVLAPALYRAISIWLRVF